MQSTFWNITYGSICIITIRKVWSRFSRNIPWRNLSFGNTESAYLRMPSLQILRSWGRMNAFWGMIFRGCGLSQHPVVNHQGTSWGPIHHVYFVTWPKAVLLPCNFQLLPWKNICSKQLYYMSKKSLDFLEIIGKF